MESSLIRQVVHILVNYSISIKLIYGKVHYFVVSERFFDFLSITVILNVGVCTGEPANMGLSGNLARSRERSSFK